MFLAFIVSGFLFTCTTPAHAQLPGTQLPGAQFADARVPLPAASAPAIIVKDSQPAEPTGEAKYTPLSASERWHYYWNGSIFAPKMALGTVVSASFMQANGSPSGWGGGFGGYGDRFVSSFGVIATHATIRQAAAAALRADPRYLRCECSGGLHRSLYALRMSFLTYRSDGHLMPDAPQFAGAYASGMISMLWYPAHYTPLVQGVQSGHIQMGLSIAMNLLHEFTPDLVRLSHLRPAPPRN
jgi:hypothetical protein